MKKPPFRNPVNHTAGRWTLKTGCVKNGFGLVEVCVPTAYKPNVIRRLLAWAVLGLRWVPWYE